jgi:hypothetical protein
MLNILRWGFLVHLVLHSESLSSTQTPSPTKTILPTTLSQTRYVRTFIFNILGTPRSSLVARFLAPLQAIDSNALTTSLLTDEALASVGAADDFNDGLGSLKSTAVL